MTSLYKQTNSNQFQKVRDTKVVRIKKLTLIAIGLSLIFGLGWGLGFAATSSDVEEVTFAFQLIFSIFVGSQGLLIFIFHGIRSKKFKNQWELWLEKYLNIKMKARQQVSVSHSRNKFPTSSRSGHAGTLETCPSNTLPRGSTPKSPMSTLSRDSTPTSPTGPTVDAIKTGSFIWQETNKPAIEMMNKERNGGTQESEPKATCKEVTVHINVVIENMNAYEDELVTPL